MTRLGEAASLDTVDGEIKLIEGARVRVATPAALYRLKKDRARARTAKTPPLCASVFS